MEAGDAPQPAALVLADGHGDGPLEGPGLAVEEAHHVVPVLEAGVERVGEELLQQPREGVAGLHHQSSEEVPDPPVGGT